MPGQRRSLSKTTEIERELGSMSARLDDLDRRMTNIERDVKEIRAFILSAKGSWKTLMIVASFSSALTALTLKVVHLLK